MDKSVLLIGLASAVLSGFGVCVCASEPVMVPLEDVFVTAESHSAQLRPSFTAEAEAARAVSEARTALLPEINANLSVSYIGDGFTTSRSLTAYQRAPIPHLGTGVGVSVEQPVYTGGAVTNSIRMAELKSTATRYATDFQRDCLRFRLTGYYLDIYKYGNIRKVIDENITLADKVLAQMRARHEQGTVLRNDITRYELLLENLKLQLIKADNTLSILNNNLVTAAGFPDGTVIVPDSMILLRSLPRDGEAMWQHAAAENAPSLLLGRSEVEMSRTAESLAKADRLPKVGLKAAWTMDGPILVEVPPVNRNLSYWYVGVGVSYNISSLFKTDKTVARSRAATRKAAERLDATAEEVSTAIREDYIRYMEAYQELVTREKSVELANRNYATISTRYEEDMALITDMLDAANSLLEAQQSLVNARIDIIYYYYKLLFTSGQI